RRAPAEALDGRRIRSAVEEAAQTEPRRREREEVERDPADHGVRPRALDEDGVSEREGDAGEDAAEQPDGGAPGGMRGRDRAERAREENPLEADLDDARTLRPNAAHGGARVGRADPQRLGEHRER